MKKFLIILVLFLIPLNIKAMEYDVKSANLKITIPDDWYVFTRENIDEKEVEAVKKELMKSFFETNSAYISAAKSRIDFILTTSDVDYASLTDYPDEKVAEIAADLGAINNTKDYRVYINNYKYIILNSKSGDYYMNTYATVINYKWHMFRFQKKTEFTADEITQNRKIIDTIEYTIIEKPKEEKKEEVIPEKPKYKLIIAYSILGIIVVALIANVILKKRGKEN